MTARTEQYNTVAFHVGKVQLSIAVVTIALTLLASAVTMAVTWGRAEERMTTDASRITNIEKVELPAIRQEITGMRDAQYRIIEIQVNLQQLMHRAGVPYQSVPRSK